MNACMGGWACALREQCPHYSNGIGEPAERLCIRGRDGIRMTWASPYRVVTVDVFAGHEISNEQMEAE